MKRTLHLFLSISNLGGLTLWEIELLKNETYEDPNQMIRYIWREMGPRST